MKNLSSVFSLLGMAFLIIIVPALLIKWEIYKYQDCKKVGHTTMYCIFAKN